MAARPDRVALHGTLRVLVQGITGREGSFWSGEMKRYGTPITAGVSPGKGGQFVHGVPVYDSVEEACEAHAPTTSVLFVPPASVKHAALEAMRCGLGELIILAEHVPLHDVMETLAEARDRNVRVLGPNCPGLVVPGHYSLGIMPASVSSIFQPGTVGVVSRSGSLGTLVCLNLVTAGFGESAFIGIGGDPMIGTTFRDALERFEEDPGTDAIVMLGEVGGTMEEDAAGFIIGMSKPVVAFIAGSSAPEGKRMGHAGAIVSGAKGTAAAKIDALRSAGVHVADIPSQVSEIMTAVLAERPRV
jgi:succinyl-CoA synthetase alpha subunit